MKQLAVLLPALCFGLFSFAAKADTLQLVSASAQTGGEYIYPYNFSVNDSTTLTGLLCMDLDRTITFGEKWNVTQTAIPTSGPNAAKYQEEAYIFSQLGKGTYSDSQVQWAGWGIFSPGDHENAAYDAGAQQLVADAVAAVTSGPGLSSVFLSHYVLYIPTGDQTGWTNGIPQEFIGTAQTPEPSSLVLLGSGLLGVAGAVRRKLARA